jgi:hypothetical protein
MFNACAVLWLHPSEAFSFHSLFIYHEVKAMQSKRTMFRRYRDFHVQTIRYTCY